MRVGRKQQWWNYDPDALQYRTSLFVMLGTVLLGLWLLRPLFVGHPGRPMPPQVIEQAYEER